MAGNNQYDVFLSHAVEDKLVLADALYKALTAKGIGVWYSGAELVVGDLLIQKIREGMTACHIAVVIISPRYLNKIWTQSEFDHFIEEQIRSGKVILPILLDITPQELAARSLVMANIWALKAEIGVEALEPKLIAEIKKSKAARRRAKKIKLTKITVFLLVIAAAFIGIFQSVDFTGSPEDQFINECIGTRVLTLTAKSDLTINEWIANKNIATSSADAAARIFSLYKDQKSRHRNEYILETGLSIARSKKKIKEVLGLDMDVLTPLNAFGLDSFRVFHLSYGDGAIKRIEQLLFINLRPVKQTIEFSSSHRGRHEVNVRFTNVLRTIEVTMTAAMTPSDIQRYSAEITAFHPYETYLFARKADKWALEAVSPGN